MRLTRYDSTAYSVCAVCAGLLAVLKVVGLLIISWWWVVAVFFAYPLLVFTLFLVVALIAVVTAIVSIGIDIGLGKDWRTYKKRSEEYKVDEKDRMGKQ